MIDPQSTTWRTIAAWLDTQIEGVRDQLEGEVDATDTERLRGRVAALRDLRTLPEQLDNTRRAAEAAAGQYVQPTFMNPNDY